MTTIIKNGLIYDGAETHPTRYDILIKHGIFVRFGKVTGSKGARVINAAGHIVCPGFIDPSATIEQESLLNAENLRSYFLREGITTLLVGADGTSRAPALRNSLYLLELHGMSGNQSLAFPQFKEYLKFLNTRKFPVNIGSYVGYETLRESFAPNTQRTLTLKEIEKIQLHLSKSLKEGGFGTSLRLATLSAPWIDRNEIDALIHTGNSHDSTFVINTALSRNETQSSLSKKLGLFRHAKKLYLISGDGARIRQFRNTLPENSEQSLVYGRLSENYTLLDVHDLLPDYCFSRTRSEILNLLDHQEFQDPLMNFLKELPLTNLVVVNTPPAFSILRNKKLGQIASAWQLPVGKTLLELFKKFELRGSYLIQESDRATAESPFSENFLTFLTTSRSFQVSALRGRSTYLRFLLDSLKQNSPERTGRMIKSYSSAVASFFGIPKRGEIKREYPADCVILNKDGVAKTFVNGELAYDKSASVKTSGGRPLSAH